MSKKNCVKLLMKILKFDKKKKQICFYCCGFFRFMVDSVNMVFYLDLSSFQVLIEIVSIFIFIKMSVEMYLIFLDFV